MRVGIGYDAHRLVEGRPLILGGCTIPFEKGLLGHSDADVLIHAIMDAILGAAALGDIGQHFPDSDEKYKDSSSLHMLGVVSKKIEAIGYQVGNLDSVIVAQQPKVASFLCQMTKNIADALKISPDAINIKATTEEGMGFTGTGEGMAAKAVALIIERK